MELGYPHPDYLQDILTSNQLAEWEAFNKIDPIGSWREDFRMASISALMVNLWQKVHGKKGAKDITAEKFMPEWYKEDVTPENVEKQSSEEIKNIFISAFAGSISEKRRRIGDAPIKHKKK